MSMSNQPADPVTGPPTTALPIRPAWRERFVFPAIILAALLLAWWWLVAMARDMYGSMTGASAWMMTGVWDSTHLLLLWAMWAVMMAAMMVPSAWPMLATYNGFMSRLPLDRRRGASVYMFVLGYVAAWSTFSVAATILQRLLSRSLLLSPMMEMASPAASAGILAIAGVYQLTPLKRVCLTGCRSPLSFVMRHWRRGAAGAFRMGAEHGALCVGCCWALMLLLFVAGVMNLYAIAALTTVVALEKAAPWGEGASRLGGALLLGAAAWVYTR